MAWSADMMVVEVGYEFDEETTGDHVMNLRSAAESHTDDERSIRVRSDKGDRHVLVVTFSMGKTAQYKVVGDIAHQFKLNFTCFYEHRDSLISFPKER